MPSHTVNLDALIARADFAINEQAPSPATLGEESSLKMIELEGDSLMYKWLRKPDFQRTTAHWNASKVCGLVRSFVSGELIPALILWQSKTGGIFVIDGAHRLSALIGWVHDDYGDGRTSQGFWDGRIPPEQKAAAAEVRRLINAEIGSYADIKYSPNSTPERATLSNVVSTAKVRIQWVQGDASRAERSFHTINTQQTPISDIEVRMIRDRKCANTIATRALISAGTGLFAPSAFSTQRKGEIRELAAAVYNDLFDPPLETPIKTLDLPVAGRSYSFDTMRLVLDFVEQVNLPATGSAQPENSLPGSDKKRRRRGTKTDILAPTMTEDADGMETIDFLKQVRKTSRVIAGTSPQSLGLHPAVYFYSATGNYQPAAFLAAIRLVERLLQEGSMNQFCTARREFEEILVKHKYLINAVVRKFGAGTRSLTAVFRLLWFVLDGVWRGQPESQLLPELHDVDGLGFLNPIIDSDRGTKADFSTERKSAVFLNQALSTAIRCGICGARVHRVSGIVGHIQDKRAGGVGIETNGEINHPYCDGTYKDWRRARGANAG